MKKDFALAFNEVLEEKQLPKEVVVEALEAAMVSAYRKTVNASSAQHVQAEFDLDSGEVKIYAEKEVAEEVQDERTEVTLEEAIKVDSEAEIGSIVIVETTPKNFGRVALNQRFAVCPTESPANVCGSGSAILVLSEFITGPLIPMSGAIVIRGNY